MDRHFLVRNFRRPHFKHRCRYVCGRPSSFRESYSPVALFLVCSGQSRSARVSRPERNPQASSKHLRTRHMRRLLEFFWRPAVMTKTVWPNSSFLPSETFTPILVYLQLFSFYVMNPCGTERQTDKPTCETSNDGLLRIYRRDDRVKKCVLTCAEQ